MVEKSKLNTKDFYFCRGGRYTIDCIVQIVDMSASKENCHLRIIRLLSSDQRSHKAEVGQVWDGQSDWLSPAENIKLNPNVSFSLKKRGATCNTKSR